ncbi:MULTISPECIES: DUF2345 domain-containing protein, partial [Pseudomonas]|uniref:DUF2345 domain-containing protein n=1 Tax=Pseudomonas TaxID=286 RepID=UPI001BEA0205
KLIANQGPVTVQAQNDTLQLLARHGLEITSTEDEISIVAKKKITLNAGGSYITLEAGGIESGTPGYYTVRSAVFDYVPGAAKQVTSLLPLPSLAGHDARSMELTDFSG